jgi:hypothetical protein
MKILLDTNILIHREAAGAFNEDIGVLFNWLDTLHYEKWTHPDSLVEIRGHQDAKVIKVMEIKLKNYHLLKTIAADDDKITELRAQLDRPGNQNDRFDTNILKSAYMNRVDILISEDRGIHRKAMHLNISDRVYTIADFLEKVTAENPGLTDYKVLSVYKKHFGNIDLSDTFFDNFRIDYPGFDDWFNRKAENTAYICTAETGQMLAFLYLKIEGTDENYSDITPVLSPKKRLKIGTFKVDLNGYKLGERFLKVIFDNALINKVDEIYVTIFPKRTGQIMLIRMLEDWGFKKHGKKNSGEYVYVRDFSPRFNPNEPTKTYPYVSRKRGLNIISIYPSYHTELLPDSILNNESAENFVENQPHRNAIKKVYISRAYNKDIHPGDLIVFYRTKSPGQSAYYSAVTTTIGVVESVHTAIGSEAEFLSLCRKRSVFSDEKLKKHWNWNKKNSPFIINFLYIHSFPKRLNRKELLELGIISAERIVLEKMEQQAFDKLLKNSNTDDHFIID